MKCWLVVVSSLALLMSGLASAQEQEAPDIVKRTGSAAEVLREIARAPDSGIPEEILDGAECVVVVPSMFKAGIGIGGRYGRGVASCKTPQGWSAPAPLMVAGGSWGLQLGAEAVDLVMLVMNEKGLQHLLSSKFKIGGDASASAGPIGRHVAAGTDWKMRSQILTYSRSRGLFAGATLNGVVVKQDADATRLLYGGKLVSFQKILGGQVPTPSGVREFTAELEKISPAERKSKSEAGGSQ